MDYVCLSVANATVLVDPPLLLQQTWDWCCCGFCRSQHLLVVWGWVCSTTWKFAGFCESFILLPRGKNKGTTKPRTATCNMFFLWFLSSLNLDQDHAKPALNSNVWQQNLKCFWKIASLFYSKAQIKKASIFCRIAGKAFTREVKGVFWQLWSLLPLHARHCTL